MEQHFFVWQFFTVKETKCLDGQRFTPHHPWGTRAQQAGIARNYQLTVPEGQPRMFTKPVQTLRLFRFQKRLTKKHKKLGFGL